ncbi:MAG: hypothetical protein GY913_22460 [Proteobacteria bacterium]|nr:hypothetical protein [Pseudomonadota bacterium]
MGSSAVDLDALVQARGRFKVRLWNGDVGVPALEQIGGHLGIEEVHGAVLSMPALTTVEGDLWLIDNPGLTTLELAPERVDGDVTITGNPLLGDEAAWAFVGSIGSIGGTVTVADNARDEE